MQVIPKPSTAERMGTRRVAGPAEGRVTASTRSAVLPTSRTVARPRKLSEDAGSASFSDVMIAEDPGPLHNLG